MLELDEYRELYNEKSHALKKGAKSLLLILFKGTNSFFYHFLRLKSEKTFILKQNF